MLTALLSPTLWGALSAIAVAFVTYAPESLPYFWVAKVASASCVGILNILIHPPRATTAATDPIASGRN